MDLKLDIIPHPDITIITAVLYIFTDSLHHAVPSIKTICDSAAECEGPAQRLVELAYADTFFHSLPMVDIIIRQIVMESRHQFYVKSPDAVIQAHPGIYGE